MPLRVIVLVFVSRATITSPKAGAMTTAGTAVGATVGTKVLVGTAVGDGVAVGKANTTPFIGTVTEMVWPLVSTARRPMAY